MAVGRLIQSTTLQAPKGKFRVVGVKTFESLTTDYLIGDFDTLDEAQHVAGMKGRERHPVYVYSDQENLLFEAKNEILVLSQG
jgi:hypothetical protein